MNYEDDIIKVLKEAGQSGLSIKKITNHVFNVHNSFFENSSKEEVHDAVRKYLVKHSRKPTDTIKKVSWGTYRLNFKSKTTKELLLKFSDDNIEKPKPKIDLSLDLFH